MSSYSHELPGSLSLIDKGLVRMGKFGRNRRAGKYPVRP